MEQALHVLVFNYVSQQFTWNTFYMSQFLTVLLYFLCYGYFTFTLGVKQPGIRPYIWGIRYVPPYRLWF